MKIRTPGTIEDALSIVIGMIGADAAGRAIDRSASLIHKMSDPDHHAGVSFAQAMLLDAACQHAMGEAPMLCFYQQMMARNARRLDAQSAQPEKLASTVMGLSKAVGDVAGMVSEFTGDDSEDGTALSHNEKASLLEHHRQLLHAADQLEDVVNARKPVLAKG